jgi:hypothetical protein
VALIADSEFIAPVQDTHLSPDQQTSVIELDRVLTSLVWLQVCIWMTLEVFAVISAKRDRA